MEKTIFEKLDQDNLSYRMTFATSQYPPLPEEVQGWNDILQELFCILSMAHHSAGMKWEEGDEKAIRQVKASEWFAVWNTR
jgi:hypothetical protein